MDIPSLLRALPLALRGCSTPELPFDTSGRIVVNDDMPPDVLSLLSSLCEPCVLHKYIELQLANSPPASLVCQALFSTINEQLRNYTELIANIEVHSVAEAYVKLSAPTLYLRLFSTLMESVEQTKSSHEALVMLSEYVFHGDPLVRKYAQVLYDAALDPLKRLKQDWEEFGSLSLDVFDEFYVRKVEKSKKRKHEEFEFVSRNVPPFLTQQEALLSFERGKAINFVRDVCGCTEFDGKNKSLSEVNKYTYDVLITKFKLLVHLRGLRDYMLLTSGNFVEALFRNDHDRILMQPVADISTYYATNFYLAAVDDISNPLSDDPDVLMSIDAYILGIGKNQKLSANVKVWEAFCGQYHSDNKALKAIVDRVMMVKYERCFASLWRLRLALRSATESMLLLSEWAKSKDQWDDREQELYKNLNDLHNLFNVNIVSINCFVYYVVIEEQWEQLHRRMSRDMVTLAEIIQAHSDYLESILEAVASPERAASIQAITLMITELESWLRQESEIPQSFNLLQYKDEFAGHVKNLNFSYDGSSVSI